MTDKRAVVLSAADDTSSVPTAPAPGAGCIWGVTAYFNPVGDGRLFENLCGFSDRVRAQGLNLMIVELAFGNHEFRVGDGMAECVIRRRTDDVLWHKERLLNIGIDALPPTCDKVVWLDADIIFEIDDWVEETAALLESYVVVQPFKVALWLDEAQVAPPIDPPTGLGEGCAMPGMAAAMATAPDRRRALMDYFLHGHPGFAWAARREVLTRHGLYDRHVLGGADVTIAHALYGDTDYWRGLNTACRNMTRAELHAVATWGRELHADVHGNVGHVPGRVLHMWHGGLAQRRYQDRWKILKDADFDPTTDVSIDDQGCLRWDSAKPELHRRVHSYFFERAGASTAETVR